MNELDKLKKYLEDVKNIETTIFTQQTLLNTLDYQLNNLELENKEIWKPDKETFHSNSVWVFIDIFFKRILPIAGIVILLSIFRDTREIFNLTFINSIFLIITIDIIYSAIITYKTFLNEKANYKQKMKAYENSYNNYLEKIELEKQRVASETLKKEYLEIQYDELYSTYSNSLETVEQMYNLDFIFPKYRNFAAMTQIAEYFLSGRCDRLDGPNGAYNLYESELKMNMIFDKLNVVVNNLEQIRRNQYMLYEEISESNKIAEQLLGSINYACDRLSDISVNTAVTAYNTKVIQRNTEMARCY